MQQKLRSPYTKNSIFIFEFVYMKWKIGLENKTNTYFGEFKSLKQKKRKENEKLLTKARQLARIM